MRSNRIVVTLLAIIVAALITPNVYSQDSSDPVPRMQIVSAYVLPGGSWMNIPSNSLNDFQKLAPGSGILNQDFSDYDGSEGWYGTGLGNFSPSLGIRFNREDGTASKHFIMRVGLTYSAGELLHSGYFKSISVPYDTLVSTQTGQETYVDSVFSKSVSMDHRTSNLQLDVSFLWSTNFEARFQVYGGVGLGAGFSFNAETSVSVFENSYTYYRDYDYYYGPTESERFRNKSGFSGNIYLPLGLDWRLGKKGFWESIHIVSEFRPALAVYSIPELDTYVAPSFGFLTGIKVGW